MRKDFFKRREDLNMVQLQWVNFTPKKSTIYYRGENGGKNESDEGKGKHHAHENPLPSNHKKALNSAVYPRLCRFCFA